MDLEPVGILFTLWAGFLVLLITVSACVYLPLKLMQLAFSPLDVSALYKKPKVSYSISDIQALMVLVAVFYTIASRIVPGQYVAFFCCVIPPLFWWYAVSAMTRNKIANAIQRFVFIAFICPLTIVCSICVPYLGFCLIIDCFSGDLPELFTTLIWLASAITTYLGYRYNTWLRKNHGSELEPLFPETTVPVTGS